MLLLTYSLAGGASSSPFTFAEQQHLKDALLHALTASDEAGLRVLPNLQQYVACERVGPATSQAIGGQSAAAELTQSGSSGGSDSRSKFQLEVDSIFSRLKHAAAARAQLRELRQLMQPADMFGEQKSGVAPLLRQIVSLILQVGGVMIARLHRFLFSALWWCSMTLHHTS